MKALIIVSRKFNGHELIGTLRILSDQDVTWTITSLSENLIIKDEITMEPFKIDGCLGDAVFEAALADCDILYIISGNMDDTEDHWDNIHVERAVKLVHGRGGTVAAICCSTPNVRYVADQHDVACFPLVRIKERLQAAGAHLTGRSLEVSGRIVTAEHQMCTLDWAMAAIRVARGETVENDMNPHVAKRFFTFWKDPPGAPTDHGPIHTP